MSVRVWMVGEPPFTISGVDQKLNVWSRSIVWIDDVAHWFDRIGLG